LFLLWNEVIIPIFKYICPLFPLNILKVVYVLLGACFYPKDSKNFRNRKTDLRCPQLQVFPLKIKIGEIRVNFGGKQ